MKKPLPPRRSFVWHAPATPKIDVTKILPLWPRQLNDRTLAGRRALLATLEKALREERRRARAGHWAYDVARHAALVRAWRSERDAIEALEKAAGGNPLTAHDDAGSSPVTD